MLGQGQQMMQQGLDKVADIVEDVKDIVKEKTGQGNRTGLSEAEIKQRKQAAESKCPPDPAIARVHFKASLVRQTENLKPTDIDPLADNQTELV